jgi:deoxyribonuclease-4
MPILKPRLGAHQSISISIDLSIDRAIKSTCECLQIFTRPPRRWEAGKNTLSETAIMNFIEKSEKANFYDTAIHMPYLPNIATPSEELFSRSVKVLIEEIATSRILKIPYIITHLGSPIKKSESFALNRVVKALDMALESNSNHVSILLENSTAKNQKWGTSIEHLEAIFNKVNKPEKIGICFDTAHAFAKGYDIRKPEVLHEIFDQIDEISKDLVKIIHVNDSKGALGSGIDQHEHLGRGKIGKECFRELMQHPRFQNISMILETPKEDEYSDQQNLEFLRKYRRSR